MVLPFYFSDHKDSENEDVCCFQVNRSYSLRAGMKPHLNSGAAQTSEPKGGSQPKTGNDVGVYWTAS